MDLVSERHAGRVAGDVAYVRRLGENADRNAAHGGGHTHGHLDIDVGQCDVHEAALAGRAATAVVGIVGEGHTACGALDVAEGCGGGEHVDSHTTDVGRRSDGDLHVDVVGRDVDQSVLADLGVGRPGHGADRKTGLGRADIELLHGGVLLDIADAANVFHSPALFVVPRPPAVETP